MSDQKPDARNTEEPATEPADTKRPPIGSPEYAQWILKLNRRRNKAAGGNKNGR